VHDVLAQIDAAEIPEVLALNKSDQVTDPAVLRRHPGAVAISARTGAGVDELMTTVSDRLRALTAVVELCIPFDRGDIAASVHRDGEVLVESADEGGLRIRARLDDSAVSRLRQYVVDDDVS
jgi:GTP-binding protein HflX